VVQTGSLNKFTTTGSYSISEEAVAAVIAVIGKSDNDVVNERILI
jgi:hypothetical protein